MLDKDAPPERLSGSFARQNAGKALPEGAAAVSTFGYASEVLQINPAKIGLYNLGHDVPVQETNSLAGERRNKHDPEEA